MEGGTAGENSRRFFEVNLLNILGYRPSLETCSRCNTPFGEAGALLQEGGELACRACIENGTPMAAATLRSLKACLATGRFGLITFSAETLSQAGDLLDSALRTHSGRRLKSLEFLHQIN